MHICLEAIIRLSFHFFKFCLAHWLLVLIFILIANKLGTIGITLLAFLINMAGLSIIFSTISPFLMAILWAIIAFDSDTHWGFKIALIPIMALIGLIMQAFVILAPLTLSLFSVGAANVFSSILSWSATVFTKWISRTPYIYLIFAVPVFFLFKLIFMNSIEICTFTNDSLKFVENACINMGGFKGIIGFFLRFLGFC